MSKLLLLTALLMGCIVEPKPEPMIDNVTLNAQNYE